MIILQEVDSARYLGVILYSKLDWSDHREANTNRANRTLGFLRRYVSHCPRELKELLYILLIHSVLEYSAQAWGPYLKKDTSRLEQVQRQAARFTCHDYSTFSTVTQILKDLKWDSLEARRQTLRFIDMFQPVNQVAIPTTDISSSELTTEHVPINDRNSVSYLLTPRHIRTLSSHVPPGNGML